MGNIQVMVSACNSGTDPFTVGDIQKVSNIQNPTTARLKVLLALRGLPNLLMVCALYGPRALFAADKDSAVAKGTYDYSVYQGAATPLSSSRYTFDVVVRGCVWTIQYENTAALTNADVLEWRTVAACDATNIYVVHFQNESAVKKVWGDRYDSEKKSLPAAMVSIYKGAYPPPKEPVLQSLWLAFAAPNCLLQAPQGTAKPLFAVDMATFEDPAYACDYRWEAGGDGPGSRTIILTSGGTFTGRTPDGRLLHSRYAPPYDKGFTIGQGSWPTATNIAGQSLPVRFEYTHFSPQPRGSQATDLLRVADCRCVVTNVAAGEMLTIPPTLPKAKVLVSDWRFADRGYATVDYVVTNRWLATNDTTLIQMLSSSPNKISLEQQARQELRNTQPPRKPRVGGIRIVLLALVVLPIGYLVAKGISRKRKQQSK